MTLNLAQILIAIALLVTGYIFIFNSLSEQFRIQREINVKLPTGNKFEPTFWSYGAWRRFRQLQRLIPDSPHPNRLRRFQMTVAVFFASGFLLLVVNFKS